MLWALSEAERQHAFNCAWQSLGARWATSRSGGGAVVCIARRLGVKQGPARPEQRAVRGPAKA